MRIIGEMIGLSVGILTLVNYGLRELWFKPRRQESNVEHVRQLEKDNKEIDEIKERIINQ